MAAISKEEYLKRYLSGPDSGETKKKKKRRPKAATAKLPRSCIIDDDLDLKTLKTVETEEVDLYEDEAPTIAGEVDERPEEVKQLETYRGSRHWKTLENQREGKARHDSDSDPQHVRQESGSNHSPQRRLRHDSGSDESPPRRQRHDSGSDQSPPRRQRRDSGSDQSPPRRQRHDSGSDQSPPRRQRHDSGSDQSPPRRQRHDSGSDQSPPRRQRHDYGSNQSSARKQRHDSDSDQSLPRRKRHNSDSDQSPPRRKRRNSDSDQTPPRRKRHNSDSDQSPPRRKRHNSDSDQSPPRRKKPSLASDQKSTAKSESTNNSSRRRKASRFDAPLNPDHASQEKMTKTLSGLKAGLSTAQSMRQENEEKRRRENYMFKKADDSVLGKNAKTVFRNKETGRRRNLVAEGEAEAEEEAKKQAMVAKYQEWGRGLAQQANRSAQMAEALHEAQKPLARARGDEDLEKMLREQERDGDPMLAFLHKKKTKTGPKAKEKPRYKGPQPPQNRFNIWPGYRWDGVDRSNGFEKSLFAKQAEKKAHKHDAYMWSIEDM